MIFLEDIGWQKHISKEIAKVLQSSAAGVHRYISSPFNIYFEYGKLGCIRTKRGQNKRFSF